MKSLSELLNGLTGIHILGDKNCAIEGIAFDSRKVLPGTLFAALPGSNVDGHQFISSAIQNGAVAVLCEKLPENPDPGITWIKVDNVTSAFGFLTSNFFGNPSLAMKVVGITGTNGKTTTATLLYRLFRELGHKARLLMILSPSSSGKYFLSSGFTTSPVFLNTSSRLSFFSEYASFISRIVECRNGL